MSPRKEGGRRRLPLQYRVQLTTPWEHSGSRRVSLGHPRSPEATLATDSLWRATLATSGDLSRRERDISENLYQIFFSHCTNTGTALFQVAPAQHMWNMVSFRHARKVLPPLEGGS